MRRSGADSSNFVRVATLAVAIRLADLRDLVELRHRRIRIHCLAHQPAELREVGNHPKRSRQVVLRVSMLSRTMVDLDLRDTSTELACNRRKIPVHPGSQLERLDHPRAIDL